MTQSVSVIIPNFNYGRFLNATVDSVLNQSHANVEVIVIDNGSTDNSKEILESYGTKIRTIFQENLGQAAARNAGIAMAEGSLISFLDADDYWESIKLERQIEIMSEDSQLIYTAMRRFRNETGETLNVVEPVFKGNCKDAFLLFPSRAVVPGGESSALISRRLLEKVGLFSLHLNSASGRDFFRRCSNYTNFDFVDEALVNIRVHGANMSGNSRRMMEDTAKAYEALFSDPEWQFARKYRHKCLSRLHWSFVKTSLKEGRVVSALPDLAKVIIN